MFNSLRNRVSDWLEGLARNPRQSSRTVFASILVIGMFALTLDLGPRMAPEYFGARLLDPLDKATLEEVKALKKTLVISAIAQTTAKETCATARVNADYNTLLNNFEASLAGILPGAGNLLLEHPATVSDRRAKLIFEIMKKYSNLKFCIPEDQFKLVYLADYKNVIGQLNFLFQVTLYEKDGSSLGAQNPIFFDHAAGEYILVEKDLVSTHKYVTEVIDRAITSAVELDRWTEQRLNNLTAETSNKLTLGSNELIKRGNDIANENVKVNSANSKILAAINLNTASIQPYPVNLGGAGIPDKRESYDDYGGQIYESAVYVPDSSTIGSKKTDVASKFSFGILNLIDGTNRDNFLAGKLGESLALYTAATNNIDPFVPGFVITPTSLDSASIALHLCKSIDPTSTTCYSEGSVSSSAVAGSVDTTNVSSEEASGITPVFSQAASQAATGQTNGTSTITPPAAYDGIVKVNVVQGSNNSGSPVYIYDYNSVGGNP